ncbi:tRNA pseudouridine synthase D [Suillus discolor]|uniref:tRNA pseudouridine synthase D n=1 Tax=Suillus discolor TaxID=1912936 RepID=A0A9P7FEN3_9AGAM|nr:tRNA pseudouridine synthase D [Suillus discolor]KAG2116077.1 tRNA pseudouridine synthase D [Suillus discolor]
MSSSAIREREDDEELARSPKRAKVDELTDDGPIVADTSPLMSAAIAAADSKESTSAVAAESVLPPSHALLGIAPTFSSNGLRQVLQTDVGISEYISRDVPPISGIIKQRFTDFLVFEVNQDHQVIHLKSLDMPESSSKKGKGTNEGSSNTANAGASITQPQEPVTSAESNTVEELSTSTEAKDKDDSTPADIPWNDQFTEKLAPYLSEASIDQLKTMFLEGREPPRVTDSGWGSRLIKTTEDSTETPDTAKPSEEVDALQSDDTAKRGKNRNGRGDRGGRGGRGGRGRGRGGRQGGEREDHRKVLSEPISSKTDRTALHHVVRELFGGKLDSETDMSTPAGDDGSRIVIKWSRNGGGRGGGRGSRGGRGDRSDRGNHPPYIHFTLQKTNRDTQDALGYLSRTLHVNIKDLAVAGTKDKRGVTVQRVSLRRGNKTVEDIWKSANQFNRRSVQDILSQRGDRGVRIADFNYRKAGLELGMLKGNAFVITLRNVQVENVETLDRAMNSIKHKGFINYYGMQRFGTAAVPTHSIGLAILKSDWHKAVSLILQNRPGEHPEVVAARDAWLVDGDLDRALALMPRRVVAERCILESYKKQGGETRNAMGALSTIPRNLRLMYVHAYQSYVWNAIVSERIRIHGPDKAVPGDIVFESEPATKGGSGENDGMEVDDDAGNDNEKQATTEEKGLSSRERKKAAKAAYVAPSIKILTEEDAHQYSIFDVIMPLPGRDVDYPGGTLGERYREFLRLDGLDPDNFIRKQKEYTLNGSYRKILQVPKDLSWSILRYTDPDVPLAQADEDKLLGFDPPAVVDNGKFRALQVNLTLGTAAYATMALREITKTETSSHFQTGLTQASEDQQFRGVVAGDVAELDDGDTEMEASNMLDS